MYARLALSTPEADPAAPTRCSTQALISSSILASSRCASWTLNGWRQKSQV